MSLNVEQIKSDISSIARSLGIKKYDVYGSTKEVSTASTKNKKPFGLNSAHKSYLLIRVWNDQQQSGVTSTSNLTYAGLTDALILAYSSAEYASKENLYDFSENCLNSQENIKIEANNIDKVTMSYLVEECIAAETKILEASSVFKSVPYNKVSNSFTKKFYFNSLDALKTEENELSYSYFYPLAQETNKIAREAGHFSFANNIKNLDILACAHLAAEKTQKHLNYKSIKSGKYKIIFSAEAFLDLLYAFDNFINAQNILDKKSLSNIETLQTQIASPIFNLFDAPLHEKNPEKCYFDEEGSTTSTTEIIKSGKLITFLHSSFTAKKFKTKTTSHCKLGSKLTISPHFLHVTRSSSFNANIKFAMHDEQNAIYIENIKALHAGVNALQGSFSLPFDGFIIENGKETSIESATVAGDFLSVLENIIYLEEKEHFTHKGISPNVWVKELSVTGNS